jgi:LysM repeat protein
MAAGGWRRYAGPAGLLLAATVVVLLVRPALHSSNKPTAPVTTSTPATTRHAAKPKPRYYTVRPGDTFASISKRTGVPLPTIERLNPNAHSTTLTIGERLRLR